MLKLKLTVKGPVPSNKTFEQICRDAMEPIAQLANAVQFYTDHKRSYNDPLFFREAGTNTITILKAVDEINQIERSCEPTGGKEINFKHHLLRICELAVNIIGDLIRRKKAPSDNDLTDLELRILGHRLVVENCSDVERAWLTVDWVMGMKWLCGWYSWQGEQRMYAGS